MKTNQLLHPTDPAAGSGSTATTAVVHHKKLIPNKDSDFGDLCDTVSKRWMNMPVFTLLYITQPAFETKVNSFLQTLTNKNITAGNRPSVTKDLKNADILIDKAIGFVKGYLKDEYEADAISHYAEFGIEHKGKAYVLPTDRNKRKEALKIIPAAITAEGFDAKKYGATFWSDMLLNYSQLLQDATATDGSVSQDVGTKNLLRVELTEVLNSIINLLQANYPKTSDAELRNWGFQKTKY